MWFMCFPVYARVCVIHTACLRSLLACILCCDCLDPLHPTDQDPPLPSGPSLAPLQRGVERPRTTLPLPNCSLAAPGHWTGAARGVQSTGDRASVAGISWSTLTPSEGTDMQRLLRAHRNQHRMLCTFCSRLVARLRRMNFNAWYDDYYFI